MQNPKILKFVLDNFKDEKILAEAKRKLKFTPLKPEETKMYQYLLDSTDEKLRVMAQQKLSDGGVYSVNDPEFLSGANISVAITKDFMEAVEKDLPYNLRYPDVENYTKQEMKDYDEKWSEVGDVREWEKMGYAIKTYHTLQAKELWQLINVCATYSAEPGIFFIDNANEMTNAKAYGQQVVATNPCGEQPLAPNSVCNLAAINLAQFANKKTKEVLYDELKETVRVAVRAQDDVIDATPYFLEDNKKQALGERRVGLGVMGLHDLLIYLELRYGSPEGNEVTDKVFETIATTAYDESIEIAKEKGSFPFLTSDSMDGTMKLRHAFINTGYMKKMPEEIRQKVLKYGIRNSHLLTVAPTGSTGTMVGVATGLEPYYSFTYYRSGRLGKFIEVKAAIVEEYLKKNKNVKMDNLPEWFVSSMELTAEQHVEVQCIIQRWIDSSISKTVNAPKGYTVEQVQKVYESLYKGGAKGGTVYVDGSRDAQVLTLTNEENDLTTVNVVDESIKATVKEAAAGIENLIEEKIYGSQVGDTCPVCREGEIKDIGGCNSCVQCGMQLKCGL